VAEDRRPQGRLLGGSSPRTTEGDERAGATCPHERAGKRRSGLARKGSPWLRATLIQLAYAAARTKPTYLAARYHRLAARRGPKRAAIALGHSVLVAVWHLLHDPAAVYRDLGPGHVDERNRHAVQRRLVRRLEGLGYRVRLEPPTSAA
jgi:transposase